MSEQRCGTCRHWKPPAESDQPGTISRDTDEPADYGECKAIEHDADWDYRHSLALTAKPPAIVLDDIREFAALRSRAEFGCVLWEPKQAPEASQ